MHHSESCCLLHCGKMGGTDFSCFEFWENPRLHKVSSRLFDAGNSSVLSASHSCCSSSVAHLMRSSNRHPPIQPVPLASSSLPSPCLQSLVPNSRDWETSVSHLSSYSPSSSNGHPAGPRSASRTSWSQQLSPAAIQTARRPTSPPKVPRGRLSHHV